MNLKDINLRDNYKKWKKNLGEYRCFFRSTPFVSLKTYSDFVLDEYSIKVSDNLVNQVLKEYEDEYFIIVDLNLNEILDLALILNNHYDIKPILNINLLFNDFGLVGTKEHISRLIYCSENLKEIQTKKYIMFIPFDRYREEMDDSEKKNKLNNQYAIGFDDLPYEEFLKELGYKGIKIITRGNVKEDLMDYINFLNSKLEVKIVKVK
ncbi:normocyte-binding protein [Clostridium sp. DSM 8431]|uniref:normocyte-binding protein n=1 Tax=Clostridium sp. DSM 8431 TaxID=1761781 RepID=UPI000B7E02F1|nr:normocyte-binding protein [Clostridium sp. DSM 8431]